VSPTRVTASFFRLTQTDCSALLQRPQAAVQWHQGDLPALAQNVIASAEAFCHCSVNCIQNWNGFNAAIFKASGLLPTGLKLGKDFSFDSISKGEPVIGLGALICSSQVSII
jgi:hypothetical protein